MVNNPRLSIITVCLNEIDNIKKTLVSVHQQSFKDFEYIVIDGGSNDGTVEILNENKDIITKLVSEKDRGLYDAMNKGLKLAIGDYVLFLNGGDYLYSDITLEKVLAYINEEDLVYGDIIRSNKFLGNSLNHCRGLKFNVFNVLFRNEIPHPASFFKREIFKKYGAYDLNYKIVADYDFYLRVCSKNLKVRSLPVTVAVFNEEGISNNPHFSNIIRKELFLSKIKNYPIRFFLYYPFYFLLSAVKHYLKILFSYVKF